MGVFYPGFLRHTNLSFPPTLDFGSFLLKLDYGGRFGRGKIRKPLKIKAYSALSQSLPPAIERLWY